MCIHPCDICAKKQVVTVCTGETIFALLFGLISLLYKSKKRENGYLLGFYLGQILGSTIYYLNHISDFTVQVNKLLCRKKKCIFPQIY